MKDKNVAGILALFFGAFGVHRFYLGQVGWGIFYAILAMSGISFMLGLIDAIVFFSMDKDAFDLKYNRSHFRAVPRDDRYRRDTRREERFDRRVQRDERREERRRTTPDYRKRQQRPSTPKAAPRPQRPRSNPYKKTGVEKYKDYDYEGAIEDFKKALEVDAKDIAVHFNLACAYSLSEKTERALYHLDQAVSLGFDDFVRIREHDALAYVRIQDEFEAFEENGFRLQKQEQESKEPETKKPEEEQVEDNSDLLEQLKKLNELRNKGLLTETEFATQKQKLLSR